MAKDRRFEQGCLVFFVAFAKANHSGGVQLTAEYPLAGGFGDAFKSVSCRVPMFFKELSNSAWGGYTSPL